MEPGRAAKGTQVSGLLQKTFVTGVIDFLVKAAALLRSPFSSENENFRKARLGWRDYSSLFLLFPWLCFRITRGAYRFPLRHFLLSVSYGPDSTFLVTVKCKNKSPAPLPRPRSAWISAPCCSGVSPWLRPSAFLPPIPQGNGGALPLQAPPLCTCSPSSFFHSTHHLFYIVSVSLALECKRHEGRDFCQFCPLIYLQCLEQP